MAIDEETDRLTRLVGNLLDLTRIQGGALKPEKEWNEIGEVIDNVVDRLAPLIRTHPLHVELAPDLPPIAFDFIEIAQVLTNLIENAAKYSDAGAAITISVECDGGNIRVCVTDQGFGIPPEDLPHVFDTFYRVRREGQARRIGGTGLGLAICKGFVEAHGGRITVVSTVGVGSTFAFTLPITPLPITPISAQGAAVRSA
jgi:two-component system sensor histidine kinase KdpD